MDVYDEIEIEDMEFDPEQQIFTFPCPCGDRFQVTLEELKEGNDIATCPSCSLIIRIIFDQVKQIKRQYFRNLRRNANYMKLFFNPNQQMNYFSNMSDSKNSDLFSEIQQKEKNFSDNSDSKDQKTIQYDYKPQEQNYFNEICAFELVDLSQSIVILQNSLENIKSYFSQQEQIITQNFEDITKSIQTKFQSLKQQNKEKYLEIQNEFQQKIERMENFQRNIKEQLNMTQQKHEKNESFYRQLDVIKQDLVQFNNYQQKFQIQLLNSDNIFDFLKEIKKIQFKVNFLSENKYESFKFSLKTASSQNDKFQSPLRDTLEELSNNKISLKYSNLLSNKNRLSLQKTSHTNIKITDSLQLQRLQFENRIQNYRNLLTDLNYKNMKTYQTKFLLSAIKVQIIQLMKNLNLNKIYEINSNKFQQLEPLLSDFIKQMMDMNWFLNQMFHLFQSFINTKEIPDELNVACFQKIDKEGKKFLLIRVFSENDIYIHYSQMQKQLLELTKNYMIKQKVF